MNAVRPVEDVRAVRPYLLSTTPVKSLVRRIASILALVVIDVGLYAALALRALVFDPKPILWGLLWDNETDWLAFLILLLLLVFWRAGLYAPRELREGSGRVVPSVFLVADFIYSMALAIAMSLAVMTWTSIWFFVVPLYIRSKRHRDDDDNTSST